MKKTPPAILIATAAAMAVSTAALVLATSPERRALGVAVAPFGWNRVIVTHALVTLPLAWTLAVGLCGGRRRSAPDGRRPCGSPLERDWRISRSLAAGSSPTRWMFFRRAMPAE